jgi:hypothetical protein
MSSQRRIQASRINGAKSRGPITAQGKANSSRNATAHGLLSKTIVMEGESAPLFAALLATMREEMQPQTSMEESLVENMAACRWRQRRILSMETANLTHEIRRQHSGDSEQNAPTRAVMAFTSLTARSRAMDLLSRYETRYDRQFCRAFDRFLAFKSARIVDSSIEPGKLLRSKRNEETAPSLLNPDEPRLDPTQPAGTLTEPMETA